MEEKNTVIPAFICGILSPLAFLFLIFYSGNGDRVSMGLFAPLIGIASGVVAIMLSLKAKKAFGKSGMGTAAFVLGIIGVSICGLYVLYFLNELDSYFS